MRRLLIPCLTVLALLVSFGGDARADTLSGTYVFKSGVTLEIGDETGDGLRLDSVEFQVPQSREGRKMRVGGLVRVKVAVSNLGEKPRKVGVAVALIDAEGGLLGVASGGSALGSVRPDRQVTFTLVFDHVNRLSASAASFKVAMETK
jgi:hypothetical protein